MFRAVTRTLTSLPFKGSTWCARSTSASIKLDQLRRPSCLLMNQAMPNEAVSPRFASSSTFQCRILSPISPLLAPNPTPVATQVRTLRPNPNKPFGMVIVRRRKMKRHKLLKWRKKFKAQIERVKKNREVLKEKALQAELNAYIAEGESYNPRQHVAEFLEKLNKFYYPLYWKGKKLPPHYVRMYADEAREIESKKVEKQKKQHVENLLDVWEKMGKLKI